MSSISPSPAAFEVILRADGPSDAFPERKVRIVPGNPLVIGRTSKNLDKGLLAGPDNAYFDSPVVSREHAFLDNAPGEDAIFITDFSTHGTLVNGQMLQRSSRHKLHNGDKLRFGTDVVRESETFVAPQYCFSATPLPPEPEDVSFPRGITFPSHPSPTDDDLDDSYSEDEFGSDEIEYEYTSEEDGVSSRSFSTPGSAIHISHESDEAMSVSDGSMDDSTSAYEQESGSDSELPPSGQETVDGSHAQRRMPHWLPPLDVPVGREDKTNGPLTGGATTQKAADSVTLGTIQDNNPEYTREAVEEFCRLPVLPFGSVAGLTQGPISHGFEGISTSGPAAAPASGLPLSTAAPPYVLDLRHVPYPSAASLFFPWRHGPQGFSPYEPCGMDPYVETEHRSNDTSQQSGNGWPRMPTPDNVNPEPNKPPPTARTIMSIPELMSASSYEAQSQSLDPAPSNLQSPSECVAEPATRDKQPSPSRTESSSRPHASLGSWTNEPSTEFVEHIPPVVQSPSGNSNAPVAEPLQRAIEVLEDEGLKKSKVDTKKVDSGEADGAEADSASSNAHSSARPAKRKAEELGEEEVAPSKRVRRIAVPRCYNKLREGVKFTGILAAGAGLGAIGVVGLLTALPEAFFQ